MQPTGVKRENLLNKKAQNQQVKGILILRGCLWGGGAGMNEKKNGVTVLITVRYPWSIRGSGDTTTFSPLQSIPDLLLGLN